MIESLASRGQLITFKQAKIFFGDKNFVGQQLASLDHSYSELHQVHGNRVIPYSREKEKADGHYTDQKKSALIIRTADCMPVFLCDDSCQLVMGLHIGWRGLAQMILTEGVQVYKQAGIGASKLHLWLGPHIQQESYWLPKSSIDELLTAHKISWATAEDKEIIKPARQAFNHWNINLARILEREAQNQGIQHLNLDTADTYTSIDHYSHRRYGFRTGLNHSFITL